MAMQPASPYPTSCIGDGPAAESLSSVTAVVPDLPENTRSRSQMSSTVTGGLESAIRESYDTGTIRWATEQHGSIGHGATRITTDRIGRGSTRSRTIPMMTKVLFSLAVVATMSNVLAQSGDAALLERARALHKQVPLIDGHNDYPWALRENAARDLEKLDITRSQPSIHTDIARLRAGGVGGQFWSVYTPSDYAGQTAVTATLEQIDIVHRMMKKYPDVFELALTAADVERIFKSGKIASMIGMEGGHSIDNSLAALRMFHRLGARYMTLTHSKNTPWADAATDAPQHGGLTPFGEQVVREMNWLGMLVDLSHVSPDTMADAISVSAAPVIFSHSSARAVNDVPRNVPDNVLQMLPKNGGIVMVTFVPGFLSPKVTAWNALESAENARLLQQLPNDEAGRKAGIETWRKANPVPRATVSDIADHIDHIKKIAG